MGNSNSGNKAQEINLCELCQEDSIKWRCIDCDKCMCEKCKTFHIRAPASAKHQIVTIETPLQDIPQNIVVDNIPCKDHATKMTCEYCQTCDRLVCPECLDSEHSKHQLITLETSLEKKLDQLKNFQVNITDNLKYCDSKNKEVQNIKSKNQSIFEESIDKIQLQERQLRDAISKYSRTLQGKVEHEKSKAEDAVFKAEQHINQVKNRLEKQNIELETALKSTQGVVIFETEPSMQTLDISQDFIPREMKHFLPNAEKITQKIQELFGTLQEIVDEEQMDFLVLRTFTTDMPCINKLSTQTSQSNVSALISNIDLNEIHKIEIEGDNIVTYKQVSPQIYDMDFTADKDIIFSDYANSEVKLLSHTGEIKPFLSVTPLKPRGIHVTRDNKILVGVLESCDPFKVTENSQRAIMVFDMNGQHQDSYKNDKNGERLFTVPRRITTNIDQDILVIDRTSHKTGRLVCLDRDGGLNYIYRGYPHTNATKEFDPRDLTVTTIGHIIVNDYSNHALHVLTGNGDLLFCKVTKDLGLLYPWTIDIDGQGQLWIGCSNIYGKQTGSKIHIVKVLC